MSFIEELEKIKKGKKEVVVMKPKPKPGIFVSRALYPRPILKEEKKNG